MSKRIMSGTNAVLEAAATELIRQSLEGVTSMSAKSDILTPWKEQDRKNHEVYTSTGFPEATRHGVYHRAWNPRDRHLNSTGGRSSKRTRSEPLDD